VLLGVDGCRGGWLAAAVDDTGAVEWTWTASFRDLYDGPAGVIAVDIPIGLPDAGVRACDVAARGAVGPRRNSVFAAPVRDVLSCGSYAEARRLLATRGAASMSAQAWGIVAAVRDVDDCVHPADEGRVVEAHPELAFALLAGAPAAPKRTPEGQAQRLTALASVWPDVAAAVVRAPRLARIDDRLDALACAWVAKRWSAGAATVLGDGARDARGLLMRIVA
jgi:predicted RNase H-like nuclease